MENQNATQAATETKPAKEEKEASIRKVSTPVLLSSGVSVRNAYAAPAKLLALLDEYFKGECSASSCTGVHAVVFREDGRPEDCNGIAFPRAYSFAVNLKRIFDQAVKAVESGESKLHLAATCWLALLDTCLHETNHVAFAFHAEELYDEYLLDRATEDGSVAEGAMEDKIKDATIESMIELAKKYDIECPAVSDMGLIGGWIMAYFIENKDNKMARRSQRMIEQGIVYEDRDEEYYHKSLRSWAQTTLAPEGDKGWDQQVIHVNMIQEMPNGEVLSSAAEPVKSPDVATVQAALNAVTPTNTAAGQPNLFPDAGIDAGDDYDNGADAVSSDPKAVFGTVGEQLDSVVLPPHIQQQMNQTAAAAAGPGPKPMAGPPLQDLKHDPQAVQAALQAIYMRLYTHLFGKCGWAQNPQTGVFGFHEPKNVFESVRIDDILERFNVKGLIADYETVNQNGQSTVEQCEGYIRGMIFVQKNLPAYKLGINIGGHRISRSIVPQNPLKQNAQNAYSRPAQEAQMGHAIAWVYNGDAQVGDPWNVRCKAKIQNNNYMPQQ